MPRLRVLAGPSPDNLHPITVNDFKPHSCISSDVFEGQVVVHIDGFLDERGSDENSTSDYFDIPERKGNTWSIQVQGRFLKPVSADDVLFGNTFDRPLKLPWGTSAALKFMNYIDPTLEHDLVSENPPWALSPLIATMPHFEHERVSASEPLPAFPPHQEDTIEDATESLDTCLSPTASPLPDLPTASQRRLYFSSKSERKALTFGPEDVITTDFAYGFILFPSLTLNFPVVSFDLMKYWDGQPVRFVCCERAKDGKPGPGKTFWCVVFEVVVDEKESAGRK